jgi:hypothetical protein
MSRAKKSQELVPDHHGFEGLFPSVANGFAIPNHQLQGGGVLGGTMGVHCSLATATQAG